MPGIISVSVSLMDQNLRVSRYGIRTSPFTPRSGPLRAKASSSDSMCAQAVYDPMDAPLDMINEAIEDMGFDAELLLPVSGTRG